MPPKEPENDLPRIESVFRTRLGETLSSSPSDAGDGTSRRPRNLPDDEPETGGDTRSRYVLRGEIGRGGMGAVLKVFDRDLRRTLAMKVVIGQRERGTSTESRSAESIVRFVEEAQVTGQLDHPGVVPVHELGVDGSGRMYFTMRLVRGEDFESVIASARAGRDGWSTTRALNALLRVCETVAYAHSKNVVHRDLKPANVMVGRFGETYVMDWGLAKIVGEMDASARSAATSVATLTHIESDRHVRGDPSVTQEGSIMGTPYCMPLEQAAGRLDEIGPHTDVYAAGCMLYQLLSGVRPYENAEGGRKRTPMQVVAAIHQGPPAPLHELTTRLPADLVAICEKAMAYDWRQRYPSMLEMAEDLRAFLEGRVVRAHATGLLARFVKWFARNKATGIALVALFVLAIASVVSFIWQQNERLTAVREEQALTAASEMRATRNARRAERQSYLAHVVAAEASLRSNEIREAKRLLQESAEELRNWEWRHLALRADGSLATLSGHTASVTDAAWDASGERILSTSEDGTARIWDARTGRELVLVDAHEGPVLAGCFTRDGRRVITFGGWGDGMMRTTDATTGETLGVTPLSEPPSCAAIDPAGSRVALATAAHGVQVVETGTGWALRSLPAHEWSLLALAFDSSGKRLGAGYEDGSARIWDLESGELLRLVESGSGAVYSVAFHPSGEEVAIGSADGGVQLWQVTGEAPPALLHRHDGAVYALAFDSTGGRLGSASFDKTVRIWNLSTERLEATLRGHDQPVHCLAFASDDRAVVTGGEDLSLRIWDVERGEALVSRPGAEEYVSSMALSPDGRRIAIGSHWGGTIEIVSSDLKSTLATIPGQQDAVNTLDWSQDGSLLAGGFEEEASVRIWGGDELEERYVFLGHEASVTSVSFRPDGSTVASGSTDNTVRIWSLSSPEAAPLVLDAHQQAVQAVRFSPDGSRLASASSDGQVILWDVASGSLLSTLDGEGGEVQAVCWSPDGGLVASGGEDARLRLWSSGTGELLGTLEGHDQRISSVDFSPDATRLVTASYDFSLRLWDVENRLPVLTLRGHDAPVEVVRFSEDGSTVVSGSFDNTVRLWRTAESP